MTLEEEKKDIKIFLRDEFVDFKAIEQEHGVRVDVLRRAARTGRLKTIQVGGEFGAHLVLKEDLKQYLKEFPLGRKKRKPRLMSLK